MSQDKNKLPATVLDNINKLKTKSEIKLAKDIHLLKIELLKEMEDVIDDNYIVKYSFGKSELPIFREIHKIKGVGFIHGEIRFEVLVIGFSNIGDKINITTEHRHIDPDIYLTESNVLKISNKHYDEIYAYYKDQLNILFSGLDSLISEQMLETARVKKYSAQTAIAKEQTRIKKKSR